jgi:hypothetical protein
VLDKTPAPFHQRLAKWVPENVRKRIRALEEASIFALSSLSTMPFTRYIERLHTHALGIDTAVVFLVGVQSHNVEMQLYVEFPSDPAFYARLARDDDRIADILFHSYLWYNREMWTLMESSGISVERAQSKLFDIQSEIFQAVLLCAVNVINSASAIMSMAATAVKILDLAGVSKGLGRSSTKPAVGKNTKENAEPQPGPHSKSAELETSPKIQSAESQPSMPSAALRKPGTLGTAPNVTPGTDPRTANGGIEYISAKSTPDGGRHVTIAGKVGPQVVDTSHSLFRRIWPPDEKVKAAILKLFDKCHLWPTQWGDEAFEGFMWAKAEFNRSLQKRLENLVQGLRTKLNGPIKAKITAISYPKGTGGIESRHVLKELRYEFETPDGLIIVECNITEPPGSKFLITVRQVQ